MAIRTVNGRRVNSRSDHDQQLTEAFDARAVEFERSPVQSDRASLGALAATMGLPQGALVLDAGCGPGLVAEALLELGYGVLGVDLSSVMIARARKRCARFGERARFVQASIFDAQIDSGLDGAISRHVLHHVENPRAFMRRVAALVKPGGVVVLCDHTTDVDAECADWHQRVERARDQTHTRNLSPGEMVDLLAGAGFESITLHEERFTLDFDEWFDRGTPSMTRDETLKLLRNGPGARGFAAVFGAPPTIDCVRAIVRGVKAKAQLQQSAECHL